MQLKVDIEILSTTEILNEIGKMYGDSLLEKMLDFCETYDIDPKLLGDILEEDENFKSMLKKDCQRHLQLEKTKKVETEDLSIW